MERRERVFLTASWRHLLMLNYEVDPAILRSRVPAHTELDLYDGKCFVSIVGFLFENTTIMKVAVPFHQRFVEINLRFYVRSQADGVWRHGVVFIKEIVARPAVTIAARWLFGEHYITLPVRHRIEFSDTFRAQPTMVDYEWRYRDRWCRMAARPRGGLREASEESLEHFLMERCWGYTKHRDESATEYEVKHPTWRYWEVDEPLFECDVGSLFGEELKKPLAAPPRTAFHAEGSEVTVFYNARLPRSG